MHSVPQRTHTRIDVGKGVWKMKDDVLRAEVDQLREQLSALYHYLGLTSEGHWASIGGVRVREKCKECGK